MLGSVRLNALRELGDALAARLSAADIRELIRLCATGESAPGASYFELQAYILMVERLFKAQDPRLSPALRRRWVAVVEARVREIYPVERAIMSSPWGWRDWHAADPVAAERYLCKELDIAALGPKCAGWAIWDLAHLASSKKEGTAHHQGALARLRSIQMAGGSYGKEARRQLELLGFVNPGRLEQVARQWRRKRDRASLNWLYWEYIGRLQPPEGHPIKPVLELLGKPTRVDDYKFLYETRERTGRAPLLLQLHADGRTRSLLVAWNLK